MMHTLGMTMDEIMELSLAQFLLLSVEASELENQQRASNVMSGYAAPGGQHFGKR